MLLCGYEGIWPPYDQGLQGFIRICRNVLPALTEASRMYRDLLPDAQHYCMEVCEGHSGEGEKGVAMAALANDRRFLILDLLTGRRVERDGPFIRQLLQAGAEDLLEIRPGIVDVLGLDYYAHNEWRFHDAGGVRPSPRPQGFAELARQYWERYRLPMVLGETNIRGFSTDRASWLKFTLEQCELAQEAGIPIAGFCWFPFIDSLDWDSLLERCDRHIDPVGIYWLDERLNRRPSSVSAAYRKAALGAPSSQLPAYRFSSGVLSGLSGFMPFMDHWEWQTPPADEIIEERLHAIAS
jgi:beta-glucosidase/6-phospho-beta-glucosidase/beta-galactosidase